MITPAEIAAKFAGETATGSRFKHEMRKTFPEPLAAPAPAGVTLPPGWEPRAICRHDGLRVCGCPGDWGVDFPTDDGMIAEVVASFEEAMAIAAAVPVRK